MFQIALPLSCHANTLQEQELYKAIYISPMLGSEITYRKKSFQGAVPIPFKAPLLFSGNRLHLVTFDLVKKTAFEQRGTNLYFSSRIKMKAITGFQNLQWSWLDMLTL